MTSINSNLYSSQAIQTAVNVGMILSLLLVTVSRGRPGTDVAYQEEFF